MDADPHPVENALGYVLGRDLDVQLHGADGNRDHWPAVLEEIIQLKPDVVLAVATFEAVTWT
jgi:ABC-type Fe3+-hydroxamate transport system substrate-binding protein